MAVAGGAYGLRGSCRFHFLGIQSPVPSLTLRTQHMGVLKSPRTPWHSGSTTTCELSQELTLRLLELKATGVFMHPCRLRLFSCFRATSVVVGFLATVPPGTISSVPSPTGKEVMSEAQAYLSAGTFFSLSVLPVWVPGHSSVPGKVTMFFYDNDAMLLHIMGVRSTSDFHTWT